MQLVNLRSWIDDIYHILLGEISDYLKESGLRVGSSGRTLNKAQATPVSVLFKYPEKMSTG